MAERECNVFDPTRFAGLADACEDGILFVDRGGSVRFVNAAAKVLLAMESETLVGGPCAAAFPVSNKSLVEEKLGQALSGVAEKPFEIDWRDPQRRTACLRVRISTMRDAAGIVGAAVFVRDITDQKEVIREVRNALEVDRLVRAEADAARSHFRAFFESAPGLYLVLEPERFRIIAASEAYLRATMTRREMILGRELFEVFPDQPGDVRADGVRNLKASLERVKSVKRSDVMAVQRYPIRRDEAAGGGWEERFWSPCNSPVFGSAGEILYIIHRVEDVTDFVRERLQKGLSNFSQTDAEIRAEQMEAEIVARGRDLQRLNEQLRESERRFRELAESIKKVFWMFNAERTELIYVSPAYEEIWGRKCEELYSHPEIWLEAIIEPDRARIADALRNHPRRGFNEEYRIRRTDGTTRWIADRAFPVHDSTGRVYRIAGVARDITERKRAEEALRQSECRLRTIFNQAGAGITELDLSGAWRFVNQRFCQIVGRPIEELLALNFRDITHPGDLASAEQQFAALIGGGPDFQIEKRFVRPDGTIVWVASAVCGVRDAFGQVQYIVAVSQDVTDRRAAEDALREREERLRLIVENVKDFAIFTFNEGGLVSTWNPGAERVFGFTEAEIVGRNVAILYTAEDQDLGVPEAERRISSVEGCAVDNRWHVRKNGERIYVSGAVRPLRDREGNVHGYAKVARDVTALKQSEGSLRELTGRLMQAQDHERRRIGRELHDSTAQALAALEMNLASIRSRLPELDDRTARLLEDARKLAKQAFDETRTISYLLHPPLLDELGLKAALRWYVNGFTERSGILVELSIDPDLQRPSDEVELAIFRIVQESLANVYRHSGSRRAAISLGLVNGAIQLSIRDDGRQKARLEKGSVELSFGTGLAGMRERVRQLNGKFEISKTDSGTTISALFPA